MNPTAKLQILMEQIDANLTRCEAALNQNQAMNATQIENQIESEPLEIHSSQYSYQREYLAACLPEELENGNPVEFARQYLAASRRAVLHELQAIGAPAEIIRQVFNP